MKLIVGLGNPGLEYVNTPHNAGFFVIDQLQRIKSKLPKDIILAKSTKFMNESGNFIEDILEKYKANPTGLYVAHDDLDLVLGSYKIQFGRGPKDHNGLKSIDEALGTNQYWHIRIGVDNRPEDNRVAGEEYVLQNFTDEELVILDRVVKEACKKLGTLLGNTN